MSSNLDLAVLRTLVAVEREGSFARAAENVGRSESAVSLQLKRLEEQVGRPLLHRAGRGMAFTDAGQVILAYAKRMIELNDEALCAAEGAKIEGMARLGVPQDFADTWLPPVLARFSKSHPDVRVETTVDRSPVLMAQLERGELDLAMTFASGPPAGARWSAPIPMAWIGPRSFRKPDHEQLRLVVFDPPCAFRAAAIAALEAAGSRWTIAFTSPNLPSLWAAVASGLGVTVRTPEGLPSQLTTLDHQAGLPALPTVTLALFDRGELEPGGPTGLAQALVDAMESTLDAAI